MKLRKLGSQGLKVAEIGLGCMSMGFVNIESRPKPTTARETGA